jgi:hypothetical protein
MLSHMQMVVLVLCAVVLVGIVALSVWARRHPMEEGDESETEQEWNRSIK